MKSAKKLNVFAKNSESARSHENFLLCPFRRTPNRLVLGFPGNSKLHQPQKPRAPLSRTDSSYVSANSKMNKEDAMNAAKDAAAGVSIKNILTTGSSTQTVPGYGSDVSELKNLFNKGQGNLLGPGQIKADCCLDKSSMDCRAVQVIYDTNSRPSWPESDFDQILGDRDHVLAGAQKPHPDISDSNEIICETITTTTPPQYEYTACEETTGVITEQCFSGWTEQLEITSLFKCINRTGNVKNITCTNPYVSSVQNYTCLEAPRQSCQIGINIDVESEYVYQCSKQLIQAKTYRCNKVLSVVATPGCEIGKMQQAQAGRPFRLRNRRVQRRRYRQS